MCDRVFLCRIYPNGFLGILETNIAWHVCGWTCARHVQDTSGVHVAPFALRVTLGTCSVYARVILIQHKSIACMVERQCVSYFKMHLARSL